MPEWCKSNHKRLMRPFTIPRHHSSSKKRFAPSLCLPPKCAAHPQAWSFPGAVGCREAVPAPCQSRAPGTARGLLSQESARQEKTRAGRMWRVGRPPEVQPAVTALPGCRMAPLPLRHWGSGKSSSLTAPIRASPPGNLLPKKSELDLRHGCPEAWGKPGFAPLRNPQHRSITEIPEHKGASQDGAAPDRVLLGTSCPQWGQARVRVPDGHIPAVGTPALFTPQGPADPPSSVVSNGAVPAIPWQPHSWGISQPQAAGSSIFSPLCWRLSRLRQQRHPRSPPRAGLEPATAAQAWLEQGAAGPAQGEREGRRMEETETATCTCFHGERQLFQQDLPREHAAGIPESSSAPEGSAPGQCGATTWVLAVWDLSERRNLESPFWIERDLSRSRGISFPRGQREKSIGHCAGLELLEQGKKSFPRSA